MSAVRTSSTTKAAATAATGVAALLVAVAGSATAAPNSGSAATPAKPPTSPHVLLLSVDGMHQSDLAWYVAHRPRSAMAGLLAHGAEFTGAQTPFPSDSFPGLVGQLTGGNPKTTGIYYDVSYNHALIDPTASKDAKPSAALCRTAPRGANLAFDESIDKDSSKLDAGQGLPGLPGSILSMTGQPRSLINPAALPIDPTTCTRVYPHSYLQVNTVFDVAKAHGMRTAWSDKHPAYEILNGPGGNGLDDLFTPEINSIADDAGHDWTQVNSLTQQYDHYKVEAVVNEINGYDHSGKTRVGMPGVFGMNFQSVSTAQKLPTSDGRAGGYNASGTEPGPVVRSALDDVDGEIATMQDALQRTGHDRDTTIILSAKHGQSPMDTRSLRRIDDGAVIAALNAAWKAKHPTAAQPLVAASLNDDGMLLWFSDGDRTPAAARFATDFLNSYAGDGTGTGGTATATTASGGPVSYQHAGLRQIYAGAAAAAFIGTTESNPRVPDLIGLVQHGVVYTGGTKKIAEHGGDDPQDRHVPLIVSGPGTARSTHQYAVETTQVAPTILALLGLDPAALQAVRAEHTSPLPLR